MRMYMKNGDEYENVEKIEMITDTIVIVYFYDGEHRNVNLREIRGIKKEVKK